MPSRPSAARGSEKGDRNRPHIDAVKKNRTPGKEPSGKREKGRGAGGRGAKESHQSRGRNNRPN